MPIPFTILGRNDVEKIIRPLREYVHLLQVVPTFVQCGE